MIELGYALSSEEHDPKNAGGKGKPRYGQVTVCWAESEEEGRRTALEWWPNVGLKGDLSQDLALPEHFEQASEHVTEEDVAGVGAPAAAVR